MHVAIPDVGLYSNLLTVDPLLLLIAKTLWVIDSKPFGATTISTVVNELPFNLPAIIAPDLSSRPVAGLTIIKSGTVV